jgi:beta-amylase
MAGVTNLTDGISVLWRPLSQQRCAVDTGLDVERLMGGKAMRRHPGAWQLRGASLCLLCSVIISSPQSSLGAASGRVDTAAVMAPLFIRGASEMQQFETLLGEAAAIGMNAVSVDVWWGEVEAAGDQQFDWSYYDTVFQKIADRGLKIVPIMSFHRCGGGPGDDCDIPLPGWLWTRFQAVGLSPDDLRYESELGSQKLDDAIVPWATEHPAVAQQFSEFMDAFEQHYASRASDFIELNISLGPTGELRYPAYNANDGWAFPDRGNFQAYSALARAKFRDWALSNFGGVGGVSARWGIALSGPDDIRPPGGHLPPGSRRAQSFVDQKDYEDTQYGRDFVDWYHGSLVSHGERLLLAADGAFDQALGGAPLGMKIPGVHWQIQCALHPRIAEITAGLVRTSLDLGTTEAARADAYGYESTMEMIERVKRTAGRDVILHFTALEMDNDPSCAVGTSMAEALVFWISHGASDHGIVHKGENALACVGGPEPPGSPDNRDWGRIRNAFSHAPYRGFTLLRLENGGCDPWRTDKGDYAAFIDNFAMP